MFAEEFARQEGARKVVIKKTYEGPGRGEKMSGGDWFSPHRNRRTGTFSP